LNKKAPQDLFAKYLSPRKLHKVIHNSCSPLSGTSACIVV
jgi:hypothetical protein